MVAPHSARSPPTAARPRCLPGTVAQAIGRREPARRLPSQALPRPQDARHAARHCSPGVLFRGQAGRCVSRSRAGCTPQRCVDRTRQCVGRCTDRRLRGPWCMREHPVESGSRRFGCGHPHCRQTGARLDGQARRGTLGRRIRGVGVCVQWNQRGTGEQDGQDGRFHDVDLGKGWWWFRSAPGARAPGSSRNEWWGPGTNRSLTDRECALPRVLPWLRRWCWLRYGNPQDLPER